MATLAGCTVPGRPLFPCTRPAATNQAPDRRRPDHPTQRFGCRQEGALRRQQHPGGHFARVLGGRTPPRANAGLGAYPFARDGLVTAARAASLSHAPSSLTPASVLGSTPARSPSGDRSPSQASRRHHAAELPQAGSGTRRSSTPSSSRAAAARRGSQTDYAAPSGSAPAATSSRRCRSATRPGSRTTPTRSRRSPLGQRQPRRTPTSITSEERLGAPAWRGLQRRARHRPPPPPPTTHLHRRTVARLAGRPRDAAASSTRPATCRTADGHGR